LEGYWLSYKNSQKGFKGGFWGKGFIKRFIWKKRQGSFGVQWIGGPNYDYFENL